MNDPVSRCDPTGEWGWKDLKNDLKELGNAVIGILEIPGALAIDLWDAVDIEVGLGFGLGGSADAEIGSAKAVVRADLFCFEEKAGEEIYIGTKYEKIAGVTQYAAKTEVGFRGYETYDGVIKEGPVRTTEGDSVLGVGAQAYVVIGGTVNVGIDIMRFFDNAAKSLNDIYERRFKR